MNTRRIKRSSSGDDVTDSLNGRDEIHCNGVKDSAGEWHDTEEQHDTGEEYYTGGEQYSDDANDERVMSGKVKDLLVLLISPLAVYVAVWLLAMFFDTDLEN